MSTYNTNRARQVAHRQIKRLGGRIGALRRTGRPDRRVIVALTDYQPHQITGLVEQGDRRAVMSTFTPEGSDLTPDPDKEVDSLITYVPGTATVDKEYKIVWPGKVDPNGIVVLWNMQVRQ
jgi:hypothetical protein